MLFRQTQAPASEEEDITAYDGGLWMRARSTRSHRTHGASRRARLGSTRLTHETLDHHPLLLRPSNHAYPISGPISPETVSNSLCVYLPPEIRFPGSSQSAYRTTAPCHRQRRCPGPSRTPMDGGGAHPAEKSRRCLHLGPAACRRCAARRDGGGKSDGQAVAVHPRSVVFDRMILEINRRIWLTRFLFSIR